MGAFDKIIGYDAIKKKLERTADVLANTETYAKLGVRPPRALLLYGEPGVGKTLMSRCLIEASGRNVVVCRKDEPNGEFVKVIKKKFKKAAEQAPSILLLDDMDKFANGDMSHLDAEEYVTVQSCIDELAQDGSEVFVLATANDIRCLPHSLLRSGRFGNKIRVGSPTGADAAAILSHYLANKNVVEGIDSDFLARIMGGKSCAALEEVVNEAGLLAGYDRSPVITMDHFMQTALRLVYGVTELNNAEDPENAQAAQLYEAYHEAGHVVMHESLEPGSVTVAAICSRRNGCGGFVAARRTDGLDSIRVNKMSVYEALGGKAALEYKFNGVDLGAKSDLTDAFNSVRNSIEDACSRGFGLYSAGYHIDSPDLRSRIEQATAVEVERCYRTTQRVINLNRYFLEAVAEALLKKGYITKYDIDDIKSKYELSAVEM